MSLRRVCSGLSELELFFFAVLAIVMLFTSSWLHAIFAL